MTFVWSRFVRSRSIPCIRSGELMSLLLCFVTLTACVLRLNHSEEFEWIMTIIAVLSLMSYGKPDDIMIFMVYPYFKLQEN